MKRVVLILLSVLLVNSLEAQISTREIVEKEYKKPETYDSAFFFTSSIIDFEQYVGQKVFMLPRTSVEVDRYTQVYFNMYNKPFAERYNVYMPNSNDITVESSIANRYLNIVEILYLKKDYRGVVEGFRLKLQDEETSEIIYYCPKGEVVRDRKFSKIPFITEGFFEKSKSDYVGEKFILVNFGNPNELKDINTGSEIEWRIGSAWECIDITLIDLKYKHQLFYIPVLIFRNDNQNEIAVNFAKYKSWKESKKEDAFVYGSTLPNIDHFLTMKEYEFQQLEEAQRQKLEEERQNQFKIAEAKRNEMLITKYGEKNAQFILSKKVLIGMSKEMCIEAWGMPFSTEKLKLENIAYEVWYYGLNTYLYFIDNKLKMIKE